MGPIEAERAKEMASLLAGGPTAVLSHTSALLLWKMLRLHAPRPVHVTVPGSGRHGRPGIVFHRVCRLADDERALIDGIRVTAPARTIVDAAGQLGSREIELAVAVAEREGLMGSRELAGLPGRYARRPGIAILRAVIQERSGPHFTRSEAERRCLDLLRAGGLPRHPGVVPLDLVVAWEGDPGDGPPRPRRSRPTLPRGGEVSIVPPMSVLRAAAPVR